MGVSTCRNLLYLDSFSLLYLLRNKMRCRNKTFCLLLIILKLFKKNCNAGEVWNSNSQLIFEIEDVAAIVTTTLHRKIVFLILPRKSFRTFCCVSTSIHCYKLKILDINTIRKMNLEKHCNKKIHFCTSTQSKVC